MNLNDRESPQPSTPWKSMFHKFLAAKISLFIHFLFGFSCVCLYRPPETTSNWKTRRTGSELDVSSVSFICIKQLIVLQHISFYCLIVSVFSVSLLRSPLNQFVRAHVNSLIISKLNRIINSSLCAYIAWIIKWNSNKTHVDKDALMLMSAECGMS